MSRALFARSLTVSAVLFFCLMAGLVENSFAQGQQALPNAPSSTTTQPAMALPTEKSLTTTPLATATLPLALPQNNEKIEADQANRSVETTATGQALPIKPLEQAALISPSTALPLPPSSPSSLFRIGFLRPAQESILNWQWYQDLRKTLLSDSAFRKALTEAEFTDIALRPCEGPEDMIQRMDQGEFELVLCPTMIYVQLRAVRPTQYVYHVILQTRQQFWDSHGGEHIRQRGVLFVRRGSDLDKEGAAVGVEELKQALGVRSMAVTGRYDAPGYFDVCKLLWDDYSKTRPGNVYYFGSPQEVVKAVVSGITDIGSCEEGVLKEVFKALPSRPDVDTEINNNANSFIRILDATKGVPTDPVVIRDRFDPLITGSELGLAATNVLKQYYQTEKGAPVLESSSDSVYDAIVEDVRRLQQGAVW